MQDQASSTERAVALSLIAFGVLFRLWLRYPTDFWEDEIIAATHAGVPLWQLVAEVVRNDTHPPLYFLQLDIWGWISRSDLWLTLNSVAWSYVAIFSLWSVAGRLYGRRVALLAAAVFAVSPSPTFLADQLRMYPMLATLFIWTFFLTVRLFRDRRRSAGAVAGLWLLQLAIINSHAIGFYAVLMEGIFALSLILAQPRERSALALWLGVYASLAVCALPWLVSGMMHDGNLGDGGGIGGVLNSLATTTIGLIARGPWLTALGILAYAAAVAAGLSSQKTRLATWSFLIAPLALSALVSLAYKPLFKWNLFSTLAAPVIALNLAIAYAEAAERRLRSLGVPAFVALLCLLAIATRLSVHISSGFRDRANLVLANYRPGVAAAHFAAAFPAMAVGLSQTRSRPGADLSSGARHPDAGKQRHQNPGRQRFRRSGGGSAADLAADHAARRPQTRLSAGAAGRPGAAMVGPQPYLGDPVCAGAAKDRRAPSAGAGLKAAAPWISRPDSSPGISP